MSATAPLPRPGAIVTDIEGTTSAISFVHEVLFPYAARELPAYVRAHTDDPEVAAAIADAAAEADVPPGDLDAVIAALLEWIEQDRKVTALKTLQGRIWEAGYRAGDYHAHVYPDAVEALRRWHADGIPLHVYSSGSEQAQRLLFGHTKVGDLSPLFSGYFDTRVGGKREPAAYGAIAETLALEPSELLFLSDAPAELDAAQGAGWRVVWVLREEEGRYRMADAEGAPYPAVARMTDIEIA